jgi:hypothetical protein
MNVSAEYTSAAIATCSGRLPSDAASSCQAKQKMPLGIRQRRRQLAASDHLRESGHGAADRAPWVERPEDVAEEDAREREADPEDDEDEDRREVPRRRLLAGQPRPHEDAQREHADGTADDVDNERARNPEEPPAAGALELRLRPEDR